LIHDARNHELKTGNDIASLNNSSEYIMVLCIFFPKLSSSDLDFSAHVESKNDNV
jgi:hypothetical protein